MNSWDCFDTLVARRYLDPKTVFDEVGFRLKIPDFRSIRIRAEKTSDGTYEGIYKNLPGINPDVEFQVELEHCFGIIENINKVADDDIIISDMYFTSEQIRRILENCGLKKKIEIIVTKDGKRKGWVWNKAPICDLHIGDNYKSDVKSAEKYNRKAVHYVSSFLNDIEEFISKKDYDLALWMRYVRLNCPYDDAHRRNIWIDQSNFNIPALALSVLEFPNEEIAFTSRDCVYLKPLYEKITGKISYMFEASRHCYQNPTEEYRKYIEDITKNKLIVDLQGSGRSPVKFFGKIPNILYVTGPVISGVNSIIEKTSDAIEKHNCARYGSLIGWNNGPIRASLEHDLSIVETQEVAIKTAVNSVNFFKIKKNKDLIYELVKRMKHTYTYKNVITLKSHI